MTVSLLEILAAARAHVAPLAAESAGYLLLAVADHVVSAPRVATADDVELMPDGTVRLRRGASSDTGVEPAIRQLLARTLEVSSSVGPALRRAAERREETGLSALVRELETALIPVNRAAAKRALSRLHRETERAKAAGKLDALLEAELAPVVAVPLVTAPVVAAAVVLGVEPIAMAAEYPEPSPIAARAVMAAPALPLVVAVPVRAPAPRVAVPAPELTLTPEPLLAVGEPAFTKPEPVVQRAKERGNATPRLGTLVTLQTLPGEEGERTERAPAVVVEDEPELDLSIDVELELETSPLPVQAAAALQPLLDPEPSCMPDVLTAMVALHTGVNADDAPTRIRDVVTELRAASCEVRVQRAAEPLAVQAAPAVLQVTPEPVAVQDAPRLPQLTPEPELVEDTWLTPSSLDGVVSSAPIFVSELADPAVHEAMTWNPGPVAPGPGPRPNDPSPLSPALLILEPAPEPSPYAPAVLPTRTSDVSELLDSFYVSDAAEERDLRSALKGMAGLDLTPMPHPYVEEG